MSCRGCGHELHALDYCQEQASFLRTRCLCPYHQGKDASGFPCFPKETYATHRRHVETERTANAAMLMPAQEGE